MVPDDPVDALDGGAGAIGVGCAGEVPLAAGGGDHEHQATNDEGVDPEIAEEGVEDCVPCVFLPFHLSEHFEILSRSYFSDGSYINRCNQPNDEPDKDEQSADWWQQENLRRVLDECGRRLHHSDSNPDIPTVAHDAKDEESADAPNSIGSVFVMLLVLVSIRKGFTFLKAEITSRTERSNRQEDAEPNYWAHDPPEQDQIHESNQERSSQSDHKNLPSSQSIRDIVSHA